MSVFFIMFSRQVYLKVPNRLPNTHANVIEDFHHLRNFRFLFLSHYKYSFGIFECWSSIGWNRVFKKQVGFRIDVWLLQTVYYSNRSWEGTLFSASKKSIFSCTMFLSCFFFLISLPNLYGKSIFYLIEFL